MYIHKANFVIANDIITDGLHYSCYKVCVCI